VHDYLQAMPNHRAMEIRSFVWLVAVSASPTSPHMIPLDARLADNYDCHGLRSMSNRPKLLAVEDQRG